MSKLSCIFFFIFVVLKVSALPPAICRAEFRWDDCGKPAKPVMYYWKQGSRCEIGYWKGCLPNPNMFADEYECINTCVFVDRPPPTESEAPDIRTFTNADNISSIDTDSTPDNHDNVSTTEITNGSTTDASTENNGNESSTLVPSPSSTEANTNGSEPANASKSDEGETNETTSTETPST